MKNISISVDLIEKIWLSRNPQHELNSDTGKDMFFDTVKMVVDDYNAAIKKLSYDGQLCCDCKEPLPEGFVTRCPKCYDDIYFPK